MCIYIYVILHIYICNIIYIYICIPTKPWHVLWHGWPSLTPRCPLTTSATAPASPPCAAAGRWPWHCSQRSDAHPWGATRWRTTRPSRRVGTGGSRWGKGTWKNFHFHWINYLLTDWRAKNCKLHLIMLYCWVPQVSYERSRWVRLAQLETYIQPSSIWWLMCVVSPNTRMRYSGIRSPRV